MARLQLALNVQDIDAAVDFYSKLFATEPAKRRPGYANFAIAEPPLKLVLFENADAPAGSLNHLGVEVASVDEVRAAESRLAAAGLVSKPEVGTCCFAEQDKVWVEPAEGVSGSWEFYTVLADAPQETTSAGCCG